MMKIRTVPAHLMFEVEVDWKERTIGEIVAPTLNYKIIVATPPQFQGGIMGIWSPEHLFLGSISSCFMTTFLAITSKSRFVFKHFHCSAKGAIERVEQKYAFTEIELFPVVTVYHASEKEKAMSLLEKTSKACIVSNSISAKISNHFEIKVEGEEDFPANSLKGNGYNELHSLN